MLDNIELAELLARQAENARPPATKAFRRAARRAYTWSEEAACLFRQGQPLTQLSAVGPYIAKWMTRWLEHPPANIILPELRRDFLSLTEARRELEKNPAWAQGIRGDLQMHTIWSDGSGSIAEMAEVAESRG